MSNQRETTCNMGDVKFQGKHVKNLEGGRGGGCVRCVLKTGQKSENDTINSK